MSAMHSHAEEGRLVFGCAACIARVERERWASAPVRIVHCRAVVPTEVVTLAGGKQVTWMYSTRMRVPDGVSAQDLEWSPYDDYADACAIGVVKPSELTYDEWYDAIATAEIEVLRIETPVPERPTAEQLPLFGGAA